MAKVSIIIPAKKSSENLRKCLEQCLKLNYDSFEIIVLLDAEENLGFPKTRVLATGNSSPSRKRLVGAEHATGEFLAFIDDDAYPSRDWLKEAMKSFNDEEVAVVGGPAVTPEEDTPSQKASGFVFSSVLVGGPYTYRYFPGKKREVDVCPTCNLIMRKSSFMELGGSDVDFWPGEDTKLCLDVINRLQKKIMYDPKVIVYHHRRKLLVPHLKQIWRYATTPFILTGRNIFQKILHLFPSLMLIGIILGSILSLMGYMQLFFLSVASIYAIAVLISSIHSCGKSGLSVVPLVFIGTILTHIVYGIGNLKYLVLQEWK